MRLRYKGKSYSQDDLQSMSRQTTDSEDSWESQESGSFALSDNQLSEHGQSGLNWHQGYQLLHLRPCQHSEHEQSGQNWPLANQHLRLQPFEHLERERSGQSWLWEGQLPHPQLY